MKFIIFFLSIILSVSLNLIFFSILLKSFKKNDIIINSDKKKSLKLNLNKRQRAKFQNLFIDIELSTRGEIKNKLSNQINLFKIKNKKNSFFFLSSKERNLANRPKFTNDHKTYKKLFIGTKPPLMIKNQILEISFSKKIKDLSLLKPEI